MLIAQLRNLYAKNMGSWDTQQLTCLLMVDNLKNIWELEKNKP